MFGRLKGFGGILGTSGGSQNSQRTSSGGDRKVYQYASGAGSQEAEDTLGCFLFGCEDPLILPDYQNNFHVKQYKRIKVYASKRPWLSTEITVKDRRKYTLFLVGTGETRGCNRPQCKIEQITKKRLLLKFGESSTYVKPRFSYRDSVAEIKFFENIGE